jgi:hypothetical protein
MEPTAAGQSRIYIGFSFNFGFYDGNQKQGNQKKYLSAEMKQLKVIGGKH